MSYCFIIDFLLRLYKDSQIYRLIKSFWIGTKINFRYSFLGRITEINDRDNSVVLNNSKFVKWFLDIYKTSEGMVTNYLKTSVATGWIGQVKKDLYFSPVKTSSIISVTIILTNIFFSVLLNREIGLLEWIMRVLLLFIGLAGLFCNANWEDIKRISLVLRQK